MESKAPQPEQLMQEAIEKEAKDERVTAKRLEKLLQHQRKRCYYTGEVLTLNNVSLEHKVPLSRGGEHVMSNVVLCTKTANKTKGTMTDEEFIDFCVRVAANSQAHPSPGF